jgi:hypothetical protein
VEYFHVVFTLPRQIAVLALQNARRIYSILFQSVAETLLTIAADPQHLGAAIGFLAVLHTWGQNLHLHPHIHCVVPGGGVSSDNSRWIACRKSFFLPVQVLSCLFRKRFLIHLRKAFQRRKLQFHGELTPLAQPDAFEALCEQASKIKWVVYAKPPDDGHPRGPSLSADKQGRSANPWPGGPEQVLKYLARYTHRVAISNRRLLSLVEGRVSFEWKDYADGSRTKTMTLEAVEFTRRFLLHVLPSGFVHIRHFGFLANRYRKTKLALCRTLLAVSQAATAAITPSSTSREATPVELLWQRCPVCRAGRMIVIQILSSAALAWLSEPLVVNTS